jgi:hypothetical protein
MTETQVAPGVGEVFVLKGGLAKQIVEVLSVLPDDERWAVLTEDGEVAVIEHSSLFSGARWAIAEDQAWDRWSA